MWLTRGLPGGWPLPGYEELGSQSLQRYTERSREPDETHMIAFVPESTADLSKETTYSFIILLFK